MSMYSSALPFLLLFAGAVALVLVGVVLLRDARQQSMSRALSFGFALLVGFSALAAMIPAFTFFGRLALGKWVFHDFVSDPNCVGCYYGSGDGAEAIQAASVGIIATLTYVVAVLIAARVRRHLAATLAEDVYLYGSLGLGLLTMLYGLSGIVNALLRLWLLAEGNQDYLLASRLPALIVGAVVALVYYLLIRSLHRAAPSAIEGAS